MADKLNLPQLGQTAIVDLKTGKASTNFQSIWQSLTNKLTGSVDGLAAVQAEIEAVQAQQQAQILQIQNALAQAAAAQATANQAQTSADSGAVPTARSGSATASVILTTNGVWQTGPTLVLNTVTAGDLTLPGTGPLGVGSTSDPYSSVSGDYRIIENATDIGFAGTWSAYSDEFGGATFSNDTIDAINAYVSARVAGGSVGYGLDFRRTVGAGTTAFNAYLYARRS